MAMKYDFKITKALELLIPNCLKNSKILIQLIKCGSVILDDTIINDFQRKRKDDLFVINHNSQVCYLRKALNEHFKSQMNGVVFRLGEQFGDMQWVYTHTEMNNNRHTIIKTEAMQDNHLMVPDENIMQSKNTFNVYVPADLFANEATLNKIKQFVNQYRLVTRVPNYIAINS